MISKELISKLKDFGLNTYESKIWIALLMRGSATAGNLSEITDVPRSRSYDVLESLEKKGFIVMKIGRPIKYMAVSPAESIERTKQRFLKDAEEKIQLVEKVKNSPILKDLNSVYTNGIKGVMPEELTGIVRSSRNIKDHISFMIKNASIALFSSSSDFLKQNMPTIIDSVNACKTKLRIITEKAEAIKELAKIAEIKNTDKIAHFCVTDKQAAIFLSDMNHEDSSLVWMNSPHSVNTMKELFEAKWALA
jgi:sugar-specific transcriptional regulator TrmB